jgi:hypothetical protein
MSASMLSSTRSISAVALSTDSSADAQVTVPNAPARCPSTTSRRSCTGAPLSSVWVVGVTAIIRTGTDSAKLPAMPSMADSSPTPQLVTTAARPCMRAYPSAA